MTAATAVAAPEWLTPYEMDHSRYAGLSHGRRTLSFTIEAPEGGAPDLYRNAWGWAYFEVTEQVFGKGEPLRLSRTGRRESARVGMDREFTATARASIERDLIQWIARVGFDTLWHQFRQERVNANRLPGGTSEADRIRQEAVLHQRAARWYEDQADVVDLYATGALGVTYLPPRTDFTVAEREARIVTAMTRSDGGRPGRVTVVATLHADGEHVGYITDGGDIIPLPGELDRYWAR